MSTVNKFIDLLHHHHKAAIEVCFSPGTPQSRVGYFDSPEKAAKAIQSFSGKGNYYISLNPVKKDLLARANNRLVSSKTRTSDADVIFDSWFFVDIDPKRPKGISSTADELRLAIEKAVEILDFLKRVGVSEESIITAISGNGAYLLIRQADYPINPENTANKRQILNFLAGMFSDDSVDIDRNVYNPSRLIASIGTLKCKGDSTPERPHRLSELRRVGGQKFNAERVQSVKAVDFFAIMDGYIDMERTEAVDTLISSDGKQFDIRRHSHQLEGYHVSSRDWAYARCPVHQGEGDSSLFINTRNGAYGCFKRCLREQIRTALGAPVPSFKNEKAKIKIPAKPRLVCMSDVSPESVDWLWYQRVPIGKLTIVEGDPGIGKSWLSIAFAKAIAAGGGLPDMKPTSPRNVIILSAEDGLSDTIRPRLDAIGANSSRIFSVDGALVFDEYGGRYLDELIQECKAALVIVDPIVAFTGASIDMNRANAIRAVTSQIAKIAENNHCAIVGIRHLAKGDQSKAIYKGLGSIDITAAARSVLLVGVDPDNPVHRGVIQIKNNLTRTAPPIGFEVHDDGFHWVATKLTADKILSSRRTDESDCLREAKEFLQETLSTDAKPYTELLEEAKGYGIAERTLKRAKHDLRVISKKIGKPGEPQHWMWLLPNAKEDKAE